MRTKKYQPSTPEELAGEAEEWDRGVRTPAGWKEAPEAVPMAGASTAISLRVPNRMLDILKAFARHEGVGYQVLLKRWLDERIREERDRIEEPEAWEDGPLVDPSLPVGARVLLMVLRRLYSQPETGREEAGLLKGLDRGARKIAPRILNLMEEEGLAIRATVGAGQIWMPSRASSLRVRRLLSETPTSKDSLVTRAEGVK